MMLTSMGQREIRKYSTIIIGAAILLFIGGSTIAPVFYWLLIIPAVLWGFIFYFFRDPAREIAVNDNALLSPADGTITHFEKVNNPALFAGEIWRISIFLSIFDVHLNRAPFAGTVKEVIYKKGSFLDARDNLSLESNEANTIIFESKDARLPLFAIRQIAGKIARRIVCIVKPGDEVCVGSKIGMMKFSSRTDLFLPVASGVNWKIKIGDKVAAGITILGELP